MAGQGKITLKAAQDLKADGWQVAYVCVPNTPHIGAVAIPTKHGSSRQRYPDIVATNGSVLAVIEVEMSLSQIVAIDIVERFREMRMSLSEQSTYAMWRDAVRRECAVKLPEQPELRFCLLTTRAWTPSLDEEVQRLQEEGISVYAARAFRPGVLLEEH